MQEQNAVRGKMVLQAVLVQKCMQAVQWQEAKGVEGGQCVSEQTDSNDDQITHWRRRRRELRATRK